MMDREEEKLKATEMAVWPRRGTRDETLMETAEVWAKRGTCPDLQVGCAVATPTGHLLSTGYNGSPSGAKHCVVARIAMPGGRPVWRCRDNFYKQPHMVVHAEANAVAQAAMFGVKLNGAYAYVTHHPCMKCTMLLIQAGVAKVYWAQEAVDEPLKALVADLCEEVGVKLIRLNRKEVEGGRQ